MKRNHTNTGPNLDHPRPSTASNGGLATEAIPPFADACRAEPAADTRQYSLCLMDENIRCAYQIKLFNLGKFCLHPLHLKIAARTAWDRLQNECETGTMNDRLA
jgi:hypothetical protein